MKTNGFDMSFVCHNSRMNVIKDTLLKSFISVQCCWWKLYQSVRDQWSEQKISERLNTSRQGTLCIKLVGMSNIRLSLDEQVPVETYTSPGTRWGSLWDNKEGGREKAYLAWTLLSLQDLIFFLNNSLENVIFFKHFFSRLYSFSDIILKPFYFILQGIILTFSHFFQNMLLRFPVAQIVEQGASNARIMGSTPRDSKSLWNVKNCNLNTI